MPGLAHIIKGYIVSGIIASKIAVGVDRVSGDQGSIVAPFAPLMTEINSNKDYGHRKDGSETFPGN